MRSHRRHANPTHLETFCRNLGKDIGLGQPFVALWDTTPHGWQWTNYVATALDNSGRPLLRTIPGDHYHFCPQFPANHWKRKQFWIFLISCIAYFETGFHWLETYQEPPPPRGPGTVSAGLLQLSVGDERHYHCPFRWKTARDVCNPQQNLTCGVHILQHWVVHDGVISERIAHHHHGWRGGARYWSTLRARNHRHTLETTERWCSQLMRFLPDV